MYCHYRIWCESTLYNLVSEQEHNNWEFGDICNIASKDAITDILWQQEEITTKRIEEFFFPKELITLDKILRTGIKIPEELMKKIVERNQKIKK